MKASDEHFCLDASVACDHNVLEKAIKTFVKIGKIRVAIVFITISTLKKFVLLLIIKWALLL